ncbi:DUF2103 domain-containing protein [Leptolyngbya sp. AN02str]|uniref:DUF2103 domain-containing protein n=1 Tax=Leptolyngbya sp. AN02str TaxID=3423363 RepID=UPI003D311A4B
MGDQQRRDRKSSASAKQNTSTGRLVWNHSTHVPGLIPILTTLTQVSGIQTITPAVIGHARSNSPALKLRVSVPIRGGFKLIARKGKLFQEVFVMTQLSQAELEHAIAHVLKA